MRHTRQRADRAPQHHAPPNVQRGPLNVVQGHVRRDLGGAVRRVEHGEDDGVLQICEAQVRFEAFEACGGYPVSLKECEWGRGGRGRGVRRCSS